MIQVTKVQRKGYDLGNKGIEERKKCRKQKNRGKDIMQETKEQRKGYNVGNKGIKERI